jgi:hypothetical protein
MKTVKPRPKPRRVVLGEMNLRAVGLGDGSCSCIKHRLKYSYPKLPLGVRVRLVAEVLE